MRRITTRPISENFRPYYSTSGQVHPAYRKQVYYSARRIFNKVTWLIVLLLGAVGLGLLNPHLHAVVWGVLIALAISYFRTRRTARWLVVRRIVPDHATQGEPIEVGIEVVNGNGKSVRDLVVRDHFSGAVDSQVALWIDVPIPAGKTWRGSYRRSCDAGMGLHAFTGLAVVIRDALGIFEIAVEEDEREALAIYPEAVPIPELPIAGQRESFSHGKYDTQTRGGSSNFTNLRGYVRGDSLRHVSWKASARVGKLMVKEFESVANTDVSILLDMATARHAGTDAESSWEQAKDAALSILAQQLANGNRVALLSQEAYVPAGGGEGHLNLIAQAIFRLRPCPEPEVVTTEKTPSKGLARHFALIAPGTTVVYIGSLLPGIPGSRGGDFSPVRERLLRLRVNEVRTICLLIDAASFVRGERLLGLDALTVAALRNSPAVLREEVKTLACGGTLAFVLEKGLPIGDALLRSGRKGRA